MWYRYRWWCACAVLVITLAAGWMCDLQDLMQRRAALSLVLREQENKTAKNKSIMINEVAHDSPQIMQSLADFNHLCAKHHLYVLSAESLEDVNLKLMVRGDYVNVRALLTDFMAADYRFIVSLHSLSGEEDGSVTAELQLHSGVNSTASSGQLVSVMHANPFCGGDNMYLQAVQSADVPLSDIRLLGILEHGQAKDALFQLPDNHVISATVGERVGKEGVVLDDVSVNAVTLLYPDHHRQILRY